MLTASPTGGDGGGIEMTPIELGHNNVSDMINLGRYYYYY